MERIFVTILLSRIAKNHLALTQTSVISAQNADCPRSSRLVGGASPISFSRVLFRQFFFVYKRLNFGTLWRDVWH